MGGFDVGALTSEVEVVAICSSFTLLVLPVPFRLMANWIMLVSA